MDSHGHGLWLQISMGSTACDFKGTFCCPGKFPAEVFGGVSRWNNDEVHKHFPDPMVYMQDDFKVIVTTAFSLLEAQEHLEPALPYFSDMAIIEIDEKTLL